MPEEDRTFGEVNRRRVLKMSAAVGAIAAVGGRAVAAPDDASSGQTATSGQTTTSGQTADSEGTGWGRLSVGGCEDVNQNECGEFVVRQRTERTHQFTAGCGETDERTAYRGYVAGFSSCAGNAFQRTVWIRESLEEDNSGLTVGERYRITETEPCAGTCRIRFEQL